MIPLPSYSVKIQIMGGKVYLRQWSKTLLGDVNKLFVFTSLFTKRQANFLAHNLNFHWSWRWWDQIQATFKNIFYFMARVISKKADQRLPQHRNRWLMVVVIKHWGLKSIAIIALVIFGLLFNVLFALFWPYCGVLVASSRIAEILLFWYLFKRHP